MAGFTGAPRTRYATCGEIDIAYQVFGDGPTDLLVLPGPLIPIDTVDQEPSMYRFHRRLASFSRVIRFDQRGIGLSSRVPSMDMIGPKSWAQDAIAVMDAVGSERATVFAPGFTSLAGLVLAAAFAVMSFAADRTLGAAARQCQSADAGQTHQRAGLDEVAARGVGAFRVSFGFVLRFVVHGFSSAEGR